MYDIIGYDSAGNPITVPGAEPNTKVRAGGAMVARLQLASGDSATVAGVIGATGTLTCRVQADFRPEFIVLSSTVSPSQIVITSVKVGTKEQIVSQSSAIPLSVFTSNNLLGKLQLDTARPGVDITISLRNTAAVAETVSMGIYGTRLDQG